MADMADENRGTVYLVGAGPGDPRLITLRAVECLRRADVVVYDHLANVSLLSYAQPEAELIYAGKKARQHIKTQDEINALLLEKARSGKRVVRLKGGDPFVFGRGGEEAQWLTEHGIAWEVVPGITSAIAVAAYAGIPVTHRDVTGSLHIITGHESDSTGVPETDWAALARTGGTIVILMGVRNLPFIARTLMGNGMDPNVPVALIRWGTMAEQETMISRLSSVEADMETAGMKPPAICVIGHVVKLRKELAWVERKPLFGLRIAVTRPVDENNALRNALEALGAEVASTPTLKLVPVPASEAAEKEFGLLEAGDYDWLCITSANGARHFARMLNETGRDVRRLHRCRVAAIGGRTAEALRGVGIIPDLVSESATQEGLAGELKLAGARRVLIARAQEARSVLEDILKEAGAETQVLSLYRAEPDHHGIQQLQHLLRRQQVHCITFTSARTFEALAEAVGAELPGLLENFAIAVIGPITRQAVEKAGVSVAIESPAANMKALADSIGKWRGRLH